MFISESCVEILVMFEHVSRPPFSTVRLGSCLSILSSLVHAFGLLTLDIDNPTCSVFPSQIPPIPISKASSHASPKTLTLPTDKNIIIHHNLKSNNVAQPRSCFCASIYNEDSPDKSAMPDWDESMGEQSLMLDQKRRVAWTACVLFLLYYSIIS